MTRSTTAVRPSGHCGAGRRTRRDRRGRAALVLAATLLVPAACSPSGAGDLAGASAPAARQVPVRLEANVSDAATVPVDTRVAVTATGGTVTQASLTPQDATANKTATTATTKGTAEVEGTVAPDGSSWTARDLLEPATAYTLTVNAANADGQPTIWQRAFTTTALSKKQQITPTLAANGTTVGVAMPVVVTLDVPVTDKAGFQSQMSVASEPAQPGAWAWISNTEAHWRPQNYWQPGTKVSVNLNLNGLPGGNGTYGQTSLAGGFTVGPALLMQADLKSHQLTVSIDGAAARTIPITAGKPGWESRSGTKVIMEKFSSLKMDAETLGVSRGSADYYSIPNVRYAMRETWSGEFLHAAPWSVGSQGRANVSHGCIGMGTGNAGWLFGQVKVGDPIVVTGSNKGMEQGNGWTDWNFSFEEFKAGSALPG